ncbi:protein like [Capsicum chacoense]
MAQSHSIEIASIDNQIPLLPQTKKEEIEEGRMLDHLIKIKETNGQDPSGSQTNESANQICDKMFAHLDNLSIKSRTIFKVNVGLSESNPDAYTPKMVSIGPYHRKNPQLWQMEKYKVLYLQRFLKREKELDVESCISELMKLKEEALKCYDDIEDYDNDMKDISFPGSMKKLNDYMSGIADQFLQMLSLDGCFVVEFIRELQEEYPQGEDKIINTNVGCIRAQVTRDLMLLENQLPFFILDKLHHMTKQDNELPFAIMAKYCFPINVLKTTHPALLKLYYNANAGNIKHLLHLIHMSWHLVNPNTYPGKKSLCCNPLQIFRSKEEPKDKDNKVMPNATELSGAGVNFTNFGNIYSSYDKEGILYTSLLEDILDTSYFDIKFVNGLMKIPCLHVFDSTESNLRNLIAFEQQYDVHHKYFSDFTTLMDYLIDSEKDVSLLRQKGIIVNEIGEDKEVTRIFNTIGKGVRTSHGFKDKEGYRKILQHCDKPWNSMHASLIHNYFSSPWVGASTVAAIILLILTTIQTILAFTGGVK